MDEELPQLACSCVLAVTGVLGMVYCLANSVSVTLLNDGVVGRCM